MSDMIESGNGDKSIQTTKEKVVILLDNSGSMSEFWCSKPRLQAAAEGAEAIISTSDENVTSYGISCFNSAPFELWPISDDYLTLLTNIYPPFASGGTMMDLGIDHAVLKAPHRIILLSDGAPTCGEDSLWRAVDNAVALKIKIDTIGIGAADGKILAEIARRTGGFYKHCDTPEQLSQHFMKLETKSRLMLEHQGV